MALVVPHSPFLGPELTVSGRFLNDGKEYLASIRDDRFLDFYQFLDLSAPVKSVKIGGFQLVLSCFRFKLVTDTEGRDRFCLEYRTKYAPQVLGPKPPGFNAALQSSVQMSYSYWNGEKLERFHPGSNRMDNVPAPKMAPGLWTSNDCVVRRDQGSVPIFHPNFSTDMCFEFTILDSETVAYVLSEVGRDILCFQSILSNKVFSRWECYPGFYTYCISYASANDRTKVLFFHESWTLLDISTPNATKIAEIKDLPYNSSDYEASDSPVLSHYEEETGSPVFIVNLEYDEGMCENFYLISFTNNKFIGLNIYDIKTAFIRNKYLVNGSNVYEMVIREDKWELEHKCSVPWFHRVEHTYRDLAGTTYYDKNGIFRYSLTYEPSKNLAHLLKDPVLDMFWVSETEVLCSQQSSSVVINVQTGVIVKSWYISAETLFASPEFQVTKTTVCTAHQQIDFQKLLPYAGPWEFLQFGKKLVAKNPKKVLLISERLRVEEVLGGRSITNLFNEGYTTPDFYYHFDGSIFYAAVVNAAKIRAFDDKMFAISAEGEVVDVMNGREIDLNIDSATDIYDCGGGTLIQGENDSFLYYDGEFWSLSMENADKMLISKDRKTAVSLKDGQISLKTASGLKLQKKPISGVLDYGCLQVFQDKLICHREDWNGNSNTVFVKPLKGGLAKSFAMPRYSKVHEYYMLSNDHFADFWKSDKQFKAYSFNSPQELIGDADYSWYFSNCVARQGADGRLHICLYYSERFSVFVHKVVNGKFKLCARNGYREYCGDGMGSEYIFGLWPNDYTKPGTHWLLYNDGKNWFSNDDDFVDPSISFIPSSEAKTPEVTISRCMVKDSDKISCARVKGNDSFYNVVFCQYNEVNIFKVDLDGDKELLAAIDLQATSAKYTTNHGLKTKYEPDFVVTGQGLLTVTILPPKEAAKLREALIVLSGSEDSYRKANIPAPPDNAGTVNAKSLLEAVSDSANDNFFISRKIDPKKVKKDLQNLFK